MPKSIEDWIKPRILTLTNGNKKSKIMDLEIKKNDTTIDLCKERDGLITIDISYQDTMDLRTNTISLTREETLKVIKQLQEYCK